MMISANFINISHQDLKTWRGPSCFGKVGMAFFSDSVSSLNLKLCNFLHSCKNNVDCLIVFAPEGVFSSDDISLWAYFPSVDYIYCNSDYDSLFDNISCDIFFHAPDQKIPDALKDKIKNMKNCEVREYDDAS